jgi:hypothetical protein
MPRPDAQSRNLWVEKAACRKADINLFYPEDGKTFTSTVIEMCDGCPVLEKCQEWSVYHEGYGYQGGMTPQQRNRVRERLRITLHEPTIFMTAR